MRLARAQCGGEGHSGEGGEHEGHAERAAGDPDEPGRDERHQSAADRRRLKDGTTDARNYTGTTRIKKTWTGQLKIWTVWPLSRKFWVLAVGPEYNWMLVGAPNHKTLSVLSRTTTLDPVVLAQITTQAAAQGFAVAKLITVPQTSRTAPAPAAAAGAAATPE